LNLHFHAIFWGLDFGGCFVNAGKTLFAQLMEFIPWTSFDRIVTRYSGNSGVRRLSCAEQFRVMAFAQLTWRESLRDIEVTLGAIPAFIHISDGKLHDVNVLDRNR
jgi:Domain of unknown function (DUF4372)